MHREVAAPDSHAGSRWLESFFFIHFLVEDSERLFFIDVRGAHTEKQRIYQHFSLFRFQSNAHLIAMGTGKYDIYFLKREKGGKGKFRDLQMLMYIITTYNTFTAGARAAKFTIPNPAPLTAIPCMRPSKIRVPTGIDSMAGLPMSRTKKQTQSIHLQ